MDNDETPPPPSPVLSTPIRSPKPGTETGSRPSAVPPPAITPPPAVTPEPGSPATPTVAQANLSGVYALMQLVLERTDLKPPEKQKLLDEIRKMVPASDRWTFRYAIWILGSVVLFSIIGMIALTFGGKSVPEGLVSIGSAAAGGLAGLLSPKGNQP